MPNLLDAGATWLADQLKKHAGTEIVYRRGAQQVTLEATIGRTEFEVDDDSGIVVRFQSRDYLVQAADLKFAGVVTLPVVGDEIHETQGSTLFVYQVMAPDGQQHFRYSDPFRRLLRIHTKQVE